MITKHSLKKIPLLRGAVSTIRRILRPLRRFPGSEAYWIRRYAGGGNSGPGSYGMLAEFKARELNAFVTENNIRTIMEFGCGDGNQLRLADYPDYTGFDISPHAIERCCETFSSDPSRRFKLTTEYSGEKAELTLSLDVIYHLIEDDVYDSYMRQLFDASTQFVVIYSSNREEPVTRGHHVRHREFTQWVAAHRPGWTLSKHIPNEHEYDGDATKGSSAEFFYFKACDRELRE